MEGKLNVKQVEKKKGYKIAIAILAWSSILLQFYISDISVITFLSYFTVLCNLLIALCLTFTTLLKSTQVGSFFSKLSVQTSIALYIFIVSLVYNIALRSLVKLNGLAWVLDNMVHVVVPLLYIAFWIAYKPEGILKWKDGLIWTLFPLCYLVYSMIRGDITGWYPYPFLNAIKFGYPRVIFNVSIIIGVFIIAGLILIAFTKREESRHDNNYMSGMQN